MKTVPALSLAALLAAPLAAQVKTTGLVQVWYNQVLDSNLRNNSAALPTAAGSRSYYNLRSEFKEDGFAIRRAELKFSGKIGEEVEWEIMADPSINTSSSNPTILQDAVLTWKTPLGLQLKAGQMKMFQTWEGTQSSSELIFAERSQMGRTLGDVRNRGGAALYPFGDPKGFGGRVVLGLFNGSPNGVDKANDNNAQKDLVLRADFTAASVFQFGAYTLQGRTNLNDRDSSPLTALAFSGPGAPTSAQVLANKDKTTNLGAYFVFEKNGWHASAEFITGLLGRRNPSLVNGAAAAAKREHLDQKFQGLALTGAWTTGRHTFAARLDRMDYNADRQWTTAADPYRVSGADYTPAYTEVTLGYRLALKPESPKAANLKLNWIHRSRNFLAPAPGQTGEQGGDSLVAAFQVAF